MLHLTLCAHSSQNTLVNHTIASTRPPPPPENDGPDLTHNFPVTQAWFASLTVFIATNKLSTKKVTLRNDDQTNMEGHDQMIFIFSAISFYKG